MARSMLVRRLWVILFAFALLALAACATGAVACSVAKPAAIALSLGAAAASFLDPVRERDDDLTIEAG